MLLTLTSDSLTTTTELIIHQTARHPLLLPGQDLMQLLLVAQHQGASLDLSPHCQHTALLLLDVTVITAQQAMDPPRSMRSSSHLMNTAMGSPKAAQPSSECCLMTFKQRPHCQCRLTHPQSSQRLHSTQAQGDGGNWAAWDMGVSEPGCYCNSRLSG